MTIDLDLGEDQRQIVDAVQDVLVGAFPLSRFRERSGGNADDGAFGDIAALGWLSLGLAEASGGAGFGLLEEVLLFRELGRHLVTPRVLASVLGTHVALACGRSDLAGTIASGETPVALAAPIRGPTSGARSTHALFDAEGGSFALFWDKDQIFLTPLEAVTLHNRPNGVDRTVTLQMADLPATGRLMPETDACATLIRRADLLVAAQLLGLAQGALELAVDYAKTREQFGQPIGAFQAIKHRCADMKVRTKVLESLLMLAALSEQVGRSDAPLQVAAARLLASGAAIENAAAGIQIHGAMGFTAECHAHLFLLRSHLLRNLGARQDEREIEVATMRLDRPHKEDIG